MPREIEESALVDGASRIRALWSIVLPMAAGGLVATAIFTFIFIWNEFLFALILTRSNVITLPVAMTSYFGPQSSFLGEVGAISMVASAPVFVLALLAQRFIARGLTLGAVK